MLRDRRAWSLITASIPEHRIAPPLGGRIILQIPSGSHSAAPVGSAWTHLYIYRKDKKVYQIDIFMIDKYIVLIYNYIR